MIRLLHIFMIFLILLGIIPTTDARINMTVSPIKYEIEVDPGDLITKTATLFNYSDNPLYITTSTAEFTSDGVSGKPLIVRPENSTSVASWVTLHTDSFILDPNAEKTISFDIYVPENATPGGHYGALFFENDAAGISEGSNIGINVDYGVLLLLNVSGEIIIDGGVGDVTINTGGATGRGPSSSESLQNIKDSCPLGDFSKSNFDGKCIDDIISGENQNNNENNDKDDINEGTNGDNGENTNNTGTNTLDSGKETNDNGDSIDDGENGNNSQENSTNDSPANANGMTDGEDNSNNTENINESDTSNTTDSTDEELDIKFEIPFENKGNTHIKPKGQIILKDENNRQIPNIGKEVILNENGAIIGEKIVDYIPINDIGGNVLPQTKRTFKGEWKGFPYKERNLEGEEIINYWTPGEYYTFQNIPENKVLNFWERILQRTNTKKIEAEIQVSYTDLNGEEVEFNSAEEFYIEYVDTYIGFNKYIIALGVFGLGFIILFIIVRRKKKKNCIECGKQIEKDIIICPYCGKKQKESKKDTKKKKKKSDIKENKGKKDTKKKKKKS